MRALRTFSHSLCTFSCRIFLKHAAATLRLRQTYERMRASYVGQNTDKTQRFDTELTENVICNKMRLGKAADLDGITV